MHTLAKGIALREVLRDLLIVGVFAGFLFFSLLGQPLLWDRDEPRNAGCAREMWERGDLMVPVFNGELRGHKPVLLYWLIIAAYSVFGVNEFASRLPSALAGIGTAGITYALGRRLFGREVGLWAALVLVSTLTLGMLSRAATPDGILILFSTLAIAAFAWGYFSPGTGPKCSMESYHNGTCRVPSNSGGLLEGSEGGHAALARVPSQTGDGDCHAAAQKLVVNPAMVRSQSDPERFVPWLPALVMYIAMGLAVLSKGPVGIVLPLGVILLFMLSQHSGRETPAVTSWWKKAVRFLATFFSLKNWWRAIRFLRLGSGIVVTACVALPWYVVVAWRTQGAFLNEFFLTHHLRRVLTPLEGHDGPILYYVGALLIGTFPWSVFAVPVVWEIIRFGRDEAHHRRGIALLAWWLAVYIGTFSLAQTKLPSYIAPCYPAVAIFVGIFLKRCHRRELCVDSRWIVAAILVLGAIGLALAVALPWAALMFFGGEIWTVAIGLLLVAGSGIGLWLWWKKQHGAFLRVFGGAAWLFCFLVLVLLPTRASRYRPLEGYLKKLNGGNKSTNVVALGWLEPSWVFYAGGKVPLYFEEEIDRVLPRLADDPFLRVIVPDHLLERIAERGRHFEIAAEGTRFLRKERFFVLAPKPQPSVAPAEGPTDGLARLPDKFGQIANTSDDIPGSQHINQLSKSPKQKTRSARNPQLGNTHNRSTSSASKAPEPSIQTR